MLRDIGRKLRDAARTALVWGAYWAVLGVAFSVGLVVLLPGGAPSGLPLLGGLGLVFLSAGLGAGGLFSLVLDTRYRDRRMAELDAVRTGYWGMLGAQAPAASVLLLLAGGGVPVEPLVGATLLLVVGALGWGTVSGAIKVAERSERRLERGGFDARSGLPDRRPSRLHERPDPTIHPRHIDE